MHYVYIIEDEGVPVYIGKGTGKRLKASGRRFGLEARILEEFDCEDAAFKRERELIAELRPTENICPGGNGGRCKPKPKTKDQIKAERDWKKFTKELNEIGPRRYVARFLLTRLYEGNCERWGVSKVDLSRLREVANGAWA